MVAVLVARVFAITHDHSALALIDVIPANARDLFNSHGGGGREADDASDRKLLLGIAVEKSREVIEFVFGRTPITLVGFTDQTKPHQRGTRELDLFRPRQERHARRRRG